MFKRVEKRRKKRRDEEELGLDEDMKDVLGLQDTDSDESESESESDESSNDSKGQEDSDDGEQYDVREKQGRKRKRGTMNDEDEDEADDEADDELGESSGGDDEDAGKPTLTIREALEDPLYIISLSPDVKGCIVCPGKMLKNIQMYNIHKASKAHGRRFKHFTELAAIARPDENALDVLQLGVVAQTARPKLVEQLSKRAEKRKAKVAVIKAKRERQKTMKAKAIAKKVVKAVSPAVDSATPSPSKTIKPAQKKRKIAPTTDVVSKMADRKPPSAVAPVEAPKKTKHLAQGTAKKQKPVGPHPERLKQKKIKTHHLGDIRAPKGVEKAFGRKVKLKPHRTKGKV